MTKLWILRFHLFSTVCAVLSFSWDCRILVSSPSSYSPPLDTVDLFFRLPSVLSLSLFQKAAEGQGERSKAKEKAKPAEHTGSVCCAPWSQHVPSSQHRHTTYSALYTYTHTHTHTNAHTNTEAHAHKRTHTHARTVYRFFGRANSIHVTRLKDEHANLLMGVIPN